jgi:SsrA-binding protein
MITANKKSHFNYKLFDRFEAGVSLLGGEVKTVRRGAADLTNSYVKVVGNEIYLVNTNIPIEGKKNYNPTRMRKLLLHKSEITSIKSKTKAQNLTLVPTKLYNKGPLIKLEIALAKSKRKFEKKEDIKRKDIDRDIERELKEKE